MKKKNIGIYKLLFLIMILMIGTSCAKAELSEQVPDKEEISIYFQNQLDGKLSAEKIFLSSEQRASDENIVRQAIEAIQAGPQGTSLLPVIPSEVAIQKFDLQDDRVVIHLSKAYHDLSVQQQMIMRASFVKTLTNFSFISSVEFLIESEPLVSPEGEEIGPIFKDDIVLVQPDPKPPTNVKNIVLYLTKVLLSPSIILIQ